MKQYVTSLFLLLITGSCSNHSDAIKPEDVSRNEGSDLLEYRAAHTLVEPDGTSRVFYRALTHTFDKNCRLAERRDVYSTREDSHPYYTERFVYTRDNAGLLITQTQYETYNWQPERLVDQITYAYDLQGRLISQKHQSPNMTGWTFEYIDDQKQVNRYSCTHSGENCGLSTILIEGKRTYPESSYRTSGYVSSSPTSRGDMLYETVDPNGNTVLIELYKGREKKTLLEKTVQTYDTRPGIPLKINEADFSGYPAEDWFRLGNNIVQSDDYVYDPTTGAVRKHLRSVSQYTYNNLGYPTQVKMYEINVLTGKSTGVRAVMAVRYGCGKYGPF